MRRLLLIAMIALLPLRALVGDAMAMAMAMAIPTPQGIHQAMAHEPACDEHTADNLGAESVTPTAVADKSHSQHDGGTHLDGAGHQATTDHAHTSCDLCNGPAIGQPLIAAPAMSAEHGVQPGSLARFASAAPLRGIKPPIS